MWASIWLLKILRIIIDCWYKWQPIVYLFNYVLHFICPFISSTMEMVIHSDNEVEEKFFTLAELGHILKNLSEATKGMLMLNLLGKCISTVT